MAEPAPEAGPTATATATADVGGSWPGPRRVPDLKRCAGMSCRSFAEASRSRSLASRSAWSCAFDHLNLLVALRTS